MIEMEVRDIDFLKGAAELIDRIKVILWPIFILTFTLTAINDKLLEKLSLLTLVSDYKTWISLGLLISASFLVANLGGSIVKIIKTSLKQREFKKNMKDNLLYLSESQKYIVHYLISNNTPSGLYLNMMHPEVNDLENKGIIYRTSEVGQLTSFAYSLTPRVIQILRKSEIILNNISQEYSEDNIDDSMLGKTLY